MKRLAWFLLIALWLAPAVCSGAEIAKIFQEANTSYRTGDYAKAAELYESLIEQEPRVATFYYDLANTYVRLGKLSRAILNYEKTLRLDPRNGDARVNLRYTRGLLEYRVEDTRNWYLRAAGTVLQYITEREINFVVLVIECIFLLGAIAFFIMGRGLFWNGWQKFVFILLVLAGFVALGKQIQSNMIPDAIVMQKECEARYGPSEHDQVAFKMGEGIKVFVMDRREDWSRILLTNGESGWVKDSDIAEVKV
ncbi:MAG: tetratricopeptide repeat protein [Candidatus Omnitrophica bacterium]|nr:tetratricopeptide repeat protein [Candidatus Omnitrophota bacterium]